MTIRKGKREKIDLITVTHRTPPPKRELTKLIREKKKRVKG
jgi:hypothetical protein